MSLLRSAAVAVFAFAWALVACGNKTDDSPTNNGVDDVKAACQIRVSWPNPTAEKCSSCGAVAALANCGCEATAGFGGACVRQGDARYADKTCTTTIDDCVIACKTDCVCVDACYANAPSCKKASAARDGCVADTCTKYCQ